MNTALGLDHLTGYCKATGDQLRLKILRVLSRESFGVLELCQILNTGQPALSHHLKILANSGMVEHRKEGTSSYYRRALVDADDPIREMRSALFSTLDRLSLDPELKHRIEDIHASRHERASSFFKKNAHRFQENQDLIVEYQDYAACLARILDNEPFTEHTRVTEIGPGDSDFLNDLAHRFSRVTAIDNNQEMLNKARSRLSGKGVDNAQFMEGELKDLEHRADLIVLNMVLHHMASPAGLFFTARQKLSKDGRLLIADLLAHDHDWTREACGDLWLGFDPDELDSWAFNAGFKLSQSQYLGLNNGFQVQVRTYQ